LQCRLVADSCECVEKYTRVNIVCIYNRARKATEAATEAATETQTQTDTEKKAETETETHAESESDIATERETQTERQRPEVWNDSGDRGTSARFRRSTQIAEIWQRRTCTGHDSC